MCRKELERSLYEVTGGKPWVSTRKLKVWYGRGSAKLNKFLQGIDYRLDGNRKEYFIPDIADAMLAERIKAK